MFLLFSIVRFYPFVLMYRHDPTVHPGSLGTNLYQREWGRWGLK